MAVSAKSGLGDVDHPSRLKLAEIAERILAENSVTEGRKLELYAEVARRLAEIDGTKTWGRSRIYAIMTGKQLPGKRLAQAIDLLHENGPELRPAPVCKSCGQVHVSKRCTQKPRTEQKRHRLVVQVPEDWKLAVQGAALVEGITVAEWLRLAVKAKINDLQTLDYSK